MGWQDQGRQEHGWFGHGTSRRWPGDDALFDPSNVAGRASYVGYAAIGALPAKVRERYERRLYADSNAALARSMPAWAAVAPRTSSEVFRAALMGPRMRPETARHLRVAAIVTDQARSHAALGHAARVLGAAMQEEGPDRWPVVLASAATATAAAGAAPNLAEAAAAAARAAGFIFRMSRFAAGGVVGWVMAPTQVGDGTITGNPGWFPSRRRYVSETDEDPGEEPSHDGVKPIPMPELPENPDELLEQGWEEITHPGAEAHGHREFRNRETGLRIR